MQMDITTWGLAVLVHWYSGLNHIFVRRLTNSHTFTVGQLAKCNCAMNDQTVHMDCTNGDRIWLGILDKLFNTMHEVVNNSHVDELAPDVSKQISFNLYVDLEFYI